MGINWSDDSIITPNFLNQVLQNVRSKIKINAKGKELSNNSALLEDFLTLVFYDSATISKNPIAGLALKNRRDIVQKYFNTGLFNNLNYDDDIKGVKFEKELSDIIKIGLNNFELNSDANHFYSYTGGAIGSEKIDLYKIVDNKIHDMTLWLYKYSSKKIRESYLKGTDLNSIGVSTNVDGKIDVAMNYFNINVNIHDGYLEKILPLLSSGKFTVKTSKNNRNTGMIMLGNTNPFRVFMNVTGGTGIKALERWQRTLACMGKINGFSGHSHHIPIDAELFFKIRTIYELTGYGAQYVSDLINNSFNDLNGADYIIYLNDAKKHVYVFSTAELISNIENSISNLKEVKYPNGISVDKSLWGRIKLQYVLRNTQISNLEFKV